PVTVRKTSKRHALKTDSSFRFERGTNPDITVDALKKAAILIAEVAGGEVASSVLDLYPNPIKPFEFPVSYQNIQRVIGKDIPTETTREIILSVGNETEDKTEEGFAITVPAYKVDVFR